MLKAWVAPSAPLTASDAARIVRSFGVPCASDADVVWHSQPAPFRGGRARLLVLTRTTMVYCRALDTLQTVYHAFDGKSWDLDWLAPASDLAFVCDDEDDASSDEAGPAPPSGALASAGALLADVFRRERDVALLTLHVRPRDAWLGDAKATRMRAVAVKRAQAADARSALLRCMDAHGRVPTLAWSERPSKTVAVVYLRRAADSFAALLSMLERICRDHGLEPVTEVVTETAASSGGLPLTHHRLRAETPRGAKTSHAISAAVGRHPRKGEMLVLEYRRKEAEQAAYDGLKIIGTVVAVAALTGLVVVASSNIATAASEAAGAAGGYVARRRRRRGRVEETHDAAADASDSDSGPASS